MRITQRGGPLRLLPALLAAVLGGQLFAAPAPAQTAKPGTLVRVTAPAHMEQPCVGHVVTSTDPLVVREGDGTMHSVPHQQIQLLEIRQERSLGSREAVLGGLVGFVGGGIYGYATHEDSCEGTGDMFCFNPFERELRAFAFAGLGGLTGAVVGYAVTPERWRPVWQREVQAGIAVTPWGLTLRVALPAR
jgi:hypothetical protein